MIFHPWLSLQRPLSLCLPFPVPFACLRVIPHPPTCYCPIASASQYTGSSNLHRTKGFLSHCWQARPFPSTMYLELYIPPWTLLCGLVTGSTRWSCQQMLFFQWGCNPLLLLQVFSQLPHQVPWTQSNGWLQLSVGANLPLESSGEVPESRSHFTTQTMSGLLTGDMRYPQVGQSLDGPSFRPCSICCPCSSSAQEHFWVKNFEMGWSLDGGGHRGGCSCEDV